MTKFVKILLIAVLITVFQGCSQSGGEKDYSSKQLDAAMYQTAASLPAPTGGFTINVGSESLSSSEVIAGSVKNFIPAINASSEYSQFEQAAKEAMTAIVSRRVADMLLFQKAKRAMPENIDDEMIGKAVDDEVRKFVASHNGNYSTAQKALEQMGLNWETFKDYQKRLMITQFYLARETDDSAPVTYQEIKDYYNAVKDKRFVSKPSYGFRLIDISLADIKVPADANSSNQLKSEDIALKLADEIIAKINAGKDFALLAKKYSNGFAAAQGGLWKKVTLGSLAKPYDVIEKTVENMKKDDIAGPIKAPSHIFIIKLEYKTAGGTVELSKVQDRLADEIRFMKRRQKMDTIMRKFISQVDQTSIDGFVDTCLKEMYYRYKN